MPFFPLWLRAKGLDAAAIGLVLAAPMVLRILTIPLTTRAADRYNALRGVLMMTCCLTVAGYALVGLAEGARLILLAYAIAALASRRSCRWRRPTRSKASARSGGPMGRCGCGARRHSSWAISPPAMPSTSSPRAI